MQTITESYLQTQLEERRRRLETAMSSGAANGVISALLNEVDAAWTRLSSAEGLGTAPGFESPTLRSYLSA
jgi:hypothetical protein